MRMGFATHTYFTSVASTCETKTTQESCWRNRNRGLQARHKNIIANKLNKKNSGGKHIRGEWLYKHQIMANSVKRWTHVCDSIGT